MIWFKLFSHFLLVFSLGWYLATNLQWYSYKIERVVLHHTKYHWHIIYFLIPLFAYYFTGIYFWIYFYFAYLPTLWLWHKKLDKKLVLTGRIKRFFGLLFALTVFQDLLMLSRGNDNFGIILPLAVAVIGSMAIEKVLIHGYRLHAKQKLESMSDLIVVGITASYGKTSIKNFLAQIVGHKKRVYATPRSVNTIGGVIKDINEKLPEDTEIYIVEMGARGEGDIAEITEFVKPHYAVVGVIGPQHIEYFKSLERIRNTKMEIVGSSRLIHAWVHKSANVKPDEKITIFGDEIKNVRSTLNGVDFDIETQKGDILHLHIPVLGDFNAINVTAALHVANALGISYEKGAAYASRLKPVEHRLQRMDAGGKIILDDSFNGNIEGMMASFELASQHSGRKIVVTPGLIESDISLNEKVAKRANEVFDLVIVTGKINRPVFKKFVEVDKLLFLEKKAELEQKLAELTKPGDLILFANDAPNFI